MDDAFVDIGFRLASRCIVTIMCLVQLCALCTCQHKTQLLCSVLSLSLSWQQILESLEKVREFKQGHQNVGELQKSLGKISFAENKVP